MAAGRPSSPGYKGGLETLLGTYRFPLYAHLHRHGSSRDEAADFTRAFVAKLMEKQYLKGVGPRPGKFRSFLLTVLKHFISNERGRARLLAGMLLYAVPPLR